MKNLQRVYFFADADKFERLAHNGPQGQGRSAARVAVHLRHDDAVNADPFVEFRPDIDRILTGHCVRHIQNFGRVDALLDPAELLHQQLVDMQPAGGVDQDNLVPFPSGLFESLRADFYGIAKGAGFKNTGLDLPAENGQLFHRGGPVNVGGHQVNPFFRGQQPSQLGGRGRFSAPLQADQHNRRGNPRAKFDVGAGAAHQFHQAVVHNLDHLLSGREALQHFLADGAQPDLFNKILDDLEVHVRFQKGHADFPKRGIDAFLIEDAAAFEFLKNTFQFFRKTFKHFSNLYPPSESPKRGFCRRPVSFYSLNGLLPDVIPLSGHWERFVHN